MRRFAPVLVVSMSVVTSVACGSDVASNPGSGGTQGTGGATHTGGAAVGGTPSGGAIGSGGVAGSGGYETAPGGFPSGGVASGGTASGGVASGGTTSEPDGGSAKTRPVASPASYKGTVNNAGGCAQSYATRGFEPDDTGTKHPLFLYFTGTNFVNAEADFRAQATPAANAVTEAMARRGFVALWAEYDNGAIAWLSDHAAQLQCLFATAPTSLLTVACALPNVDCNLGIAMWGHSQGAFLANSAHGFDPRVRAVWLAGYGGDAKSNMPKDRIRVENGENDTSNGQAATLNPIVGLTTAECPDLPAPGRSSCFRPDGSGWVIVRAADCVNSTADHCWFDKKTCTDGVATLEPNWIDPASTKPFALEPNADWVAATTKRP